MCLCAAVRSLLHKKYINIPIPSDHFYHFHPFFKTGVFMMYGIGNQPSARGLILYVSHMICPDMVYIRDKV
jgi:hypothetical protein